MSFIDSEWNLRSLVSDFISLNRKHGGEDLAKIIYNVLQFYGIGKKF